MGEYASEKFRRKCPHLTKEWGKAGTIKIQAVRTSVREAEKATHALQGYEPTAVDFIRRCANDDQALEIINFLEEQEEIEASYARRLRAQLVRYGLRSFGKRKKSGYYDRGE